MLRRRGAQQSAGGMNRRRTAKASSSKPSSSTPAGAGVEVEEQQRGQFFAASTTSSLMSSSELRKKLASFHEVESAFEAQAPPECLAAWRLGDLIERRLAEQSLSSAKTLFREWDLDGNGTLSREEYVRPRTPSA